jgi:dipeptidyl aminopeptidase/acylaminoacyl peptidase
VIAQGLADPQRACIFGASYGGYSALMMSVRYPDMFKCVVSASGPSDLVRMLRWERAEEGSDSAPYKYWVSQIGHPSDDRAMVEAASPALQADKVKAPVMLIHGKRDNTVPFEQSEFMQDALKKAGKQVELVTFETAAHGFSGRDAKRYFSRLETFFGKNLGISPTPLLPEPVDEDPAAPSGKNPP